jgi:hypothetical protein
MIFSKNRTKRRRKSEFFDKPYNSLPIFSWKETVERMRHSTALKRQLQADKESEEFEEGMASIGMLRKLSRIGQDGKNDLDVSFLK